jgi:hypothetical protein
MEKISTEKAELNKLNKQERILLLEERIQGLKKPLEGQDKENENDKQCLRTVVENKATLEARALGGLLFF